MPGTLTLLAALVASPVAMLLCHALLGRLARKSAPQKVAVLAVLAASVPFVAVLRLLARTAPGPGGPVTAIYAAVVYAGVGYVYFHLFNMSETARRIRILCELAQSGSLPVERLVSGYGAAEVIGVRLDRLMATGQLAIRDGRYVLSGRVLAAVAAIIAAWRGLLGFDRPPRVSGRRG